MALAVDMTLLTFTIVALAVGALKTANFFKRREIFSLFGPYGLQTKNMQENACICRALRSLFSFHLYDACGADSVAAMTISTVASVAPGGDGTHHTLHERNRDHFLKNSPRGGAGRPSSPCN